MVMNKGEVLYNGIQLPRKWPPENNEVWFDDETREPMPVPYLQASSIPEVIPIDMGRQLFIDDFLIEDTTLQRVFHQPEKYSENPIVVPCRDYEKSSVYLVGEPVLWDPEQEEFKMYYSPGHWIAPRALLISKDGLVWERPNLDVRPPTNIVMDSFEKFAICSVLRDESESDPNHRYKAHGWNHNSTNKSVFLTSADGIHWREEARWKDDYQDTTNIFYNPFRDRWIYNPKMGGRHGRSRGYAEVDSFDDLLKKEVIEENITKWYRADAIDDSSQELELTPEAQIYDLFATAYESIMLGAINVWYGPDNSICHEKKIPKLLQVHMGYSRDGFHWHRPVREPFIPARRDEGPGHPEYGYLRPAGSVVNIVGDSLYFYYMAASGIDREGQPGVYTGITINLATLRRDGFASMEADRGEGSLCTRPVTFKGRYLFVNTDCSSGQLEVEIIDSNEKPLEPYTRENCQIIQTDSTCKRVTWKSAGDLSPLEDRAVRFRFHLQKGKLFSFWVSPDTNGASYGYLGGGGPGYAGIKDTTGAEN